MRRPMVVTEVVDVRNLREDGAMTLGFVWGGGGGGGRLGFRV